MSLTNSTHKTPLVPFLDLLFPQQRQGHPESHVVKKQGHCLRAGGWAAILGTSLWANGEWNKFFEGITMWESLSYFFLTYPNYYGNWFVELGCCSPGSSGGQPPQWGNRCSSGRGRPWTCRGGATTGGCVTSSKDFKERDQLRQYLFGLQIKTREKKKKNRENPEVWFGETLLNPKQ